jgi:hypothetical protein
MERDADGSDVPRLFHRLNNQLGVILANAELLESRLGDHAQRARAAQIVAGAIEAMAAVQQLRGIAEPVSDR